VGVEPRLDGEPQSEQISGFDAGSGTGSRAAFAARKDGAAAGRSAHGMPDRGMDDSGLAGDPSPSSPFSGLLLSRVSAFYLAGSALMLALAVLLLSALGWWYISQLSSGLVTLRFLAALLVAQTVLLIGCGLAARLLWRRSRVVLALRKGERLASRLMVVLLRSSGEVWALLWLAGSLALGLLIIIAPDSLWPLLPLAAGSADWLSSYPWLVQWLGFLLLGIAVIATGASIAAMGLLISGFSAERLALMLQVADDTRHVSEKLQQAAGSEEVLRAFR